MKIDDLIQLLNNRLREFKLSRDYAKMSGDLGRMNTADKEIIGLEDTLYQLNLLVDTSRSAAVREDILSEVITDGSIAVLGEYDITPYATDPLHEEKIMNILSKMGVMDTVEKIDDYIDGKYLSSQITGEMVMSAASAYSVDTRLMMAIMEQDSSLGTAGVAVRTRNPGNVGNDDDGNTRTYESWQEGVTAVAEWLSRHRGETIISETPEEIILEPTATSTPSFITPTATSTPTITTSTTTTITNLPTTATTTPTTSTTTAMTAPSTSSGQATSTTTTATTTPVTPNQDSSNSSGTGQAATSAPSTSTTTPVTASSISSPQTSLWQATTTQETATTTAN